MTTIPESERGFEGLLNEIESENDPMRFDPVQNRDQTRSQIALLVVKFYFGLLGVVLIGVPFFNFVTAYKLGGSTELALSVKDIISIVSGIISGPFGFVVGYYFKGSENT